MEAINTINLAKKLNAYETIQCWTRPPTKNIQQPFRFLLVLDFEATCWDKRGNVRVENEIIEFPCVLYDLSKQEVLEIFQQYVKPTENEILSSFCTDLTGIQQATVEAGVVLSECLELFVKWVNGLLEKYGLVLNKRAGVINGAFATWSDWDLGTCLKKECRRKRLYRPSWFNKWIDVRAIYKAHYLRAPKGLNGALNDLGLKFVGRQHCGLDDATNTANLIGKMASQGVVFKITKDL